MFPETKSIAARCGSMKTSSEPKKRGRPKKHQSDVDRVNDYRKRKTSDGRRFDVYISTQASWRLTALSKAWGCSRGSAIERLLMEADNQYEGILFPET